MPRPIYIGDLSRNDVAVLARCSAGASSILEFGVGGSTQIMAQCSPPGTPILSVDTSREWIDRTRENFRALDLPDKVSYVLYDDFKGRPGDGRFDLVFDDGKSELRLEFALLAWPLLEDGGLFLVHDTRKWHIRQVAEILCRHGDTIRNVRVNTGDSNITVIEKRPPLPYRNWNADEGRDPWEYCQGTRPADWAERLKRKSGGSPGK